MALKRKSDKIEENNSGSDTETESTTDTNNKVKKTETNSSGKADDKSKEEIFKILSHDNIKNLKANEVKEWLSEIAYQLLNNVVIFINGKEHMLVEIEFYFNGYNHVDEFTHGDSMQRERGTWYFHRTNGAGYKGGSFKGMDITFGCGSGDGASKDDNGAYGGILIRSVQKLSDQSIIDGPSLCVDNILKLTNSKDVASFVQDNGRSIFQSENPLLYMKLRSEVEKEQPKLVLPKVVAPNNILSCGRVGLTFKRYKKGQEYFIGGDYRYLRLPDKVKKGKHYMTVKLALAGKDSVSIKNIIGSTAAAIDKLKAQVKIGQSKSRDDLKDYKGDLTTDEICQLLSLCDKLTKERDTSDNSQDNDDNDNDNDDKENEEEQDADSQDE
ncbi:hypothetical protein DICPUDRAFT_96310 [Dictyostelium purpureum]|uniref:Uncharacterized protein n=1 Tax=Dictyostelium purpureum TaxID=5786 RepID=F0Z777_DICPU|nr:uncharacterized protein DICPUDRAFT_96310 [Dictyostelium purpureum]EGC40210.1 hypothetical protein DICPUDRAFT_96310 [Dictyostelium purpureum]|eukprot:XP_003283279.1 hypothetical protein DICPUDRAFT_96310 [Dictyostelium purpureum]